ALLLEPRRAWTQHERAAAPFLGGCNGCDAGFFADDPAQQELDIRLTIDAHRRARPFTVADDGERFAMLWGGPLLWGGSLLWGGPFRAADIDSGSAAIIVLAVTEPARYAQWSTVGIDDDHGMHAVGLARAAVVFDRLAGAVGTSRRHRAAMMPRSTRRSLDVSPLLLDLGPSVEAPLDFLLEPALLRIVVLAAFERRRQTRHVGDRILFVVGVAIAFAVLEILHQSGWRIPQMQRHRLRHVLVRIFGSLAIRFVHRVALWRRRQIDRRLRERGVPFRHADEMDGILRGDCDRQRLRVGVADVLGREAHEPPRDVQWILTRFEHPREPVHRRVGIAVAHRLVKRGDEVVMLFSAFVV